MIFLHQNDRLGQLEVGEVFLYYDGPRLFVAENASGQKFLVNCLDSDNKFETWLLVSVSERRLFALKDRNLSLRDAFTAPELGYAVEFTTDMSGILQTFNTRVPEQLRNKDLPEPGVLLPIADKDRKEESVPNAAFLARTLNASVVLLHVFQNKRMGEAPAKEVGHILSSFENYLSVKLDNALLDVQTATRPIHGQIERPFEVNIVGTFAGSFGIEIAVRGTDERIGRTLKAAVEDLGTADETTVFRARMSRADDEEAAAMRKFMSGLAKAKSDLSLEVASQSDSEPYTASVPLPRLREAVKALQRSPKLGTDTRTLEAELVGLNLRTRKFELAVIKTQERIQGVMAAPIFSDLKRAELPSLYRVVIEGDVRESEVGNERLISNWRMISAVKL